MKEFLALLIGGVLVYLYLENRDEIGGCGCNANINGLPAPASASAVSAVTNPGTIPAAEGSNNSTCSTTAIPIPFVPPVILNDSNRNSGRYILEAAGDPSATPAYVNY